MRVSRLSPDLDTALPNRVTPEQLNKARFRIAELLNVDIEVIDSKITLAQQLRGVSEAVSTIVSADGEIEVADLTQTERFNPLIMPEEYTCVILRRLLTPETKTGIMFTAQPSQGSGANMCMSFIEGQEAI